MSTTAPPSKWGTMIEDLQESGSTLEQIAMECGCTIRTLSYLKRGERGRKRGVGYRLADRLRTMHARRLPMRTPPGPLPPTSGRESLAPPP